MVTFWKQKKIFCDDSFPAICKGFTGEIEGKTSNSLFCVSRFTLFGGDDLKIFIRNIEEYVLFLCCLSAEVDINDFYEFGLYSYEYKRRNIPAFVFITVETKLVKIIDVHFRWKTA